MRTFVTTEEILELAEERLDLINPNPDKIPEIAARMDMVFNEEIGMYEDVEEYMVTMLRLRSKEYGRIEAQDVEDINHSKLKP